MGKRIVLADPRGFCAGVDRAILTVRTILKSADTPRADGLPPVYVRRQIVHNKHVVEDLAAQGAVFVQELAEIPMPPPKPASQSYFPPTACLRRSKPRPRRAACMWSMPLARW